jgi:hypothetical protein
MLTPATRNFVLGSGAAAAAWMVAWAPLSYVIVLILIAAPIVSIALIRTWPVHVEPENPMAKYRRDPLEDPDEF